MTLRRRTLISFGGSSVPPDDSRGAILAAAVKEFSRTGRSGARVDAIARSAAVNKQLIYYYFGSKDRLFGEAVSWSVAQLAKELDVGSVEPDELAGKLIKYHQDNPDVLRLILWEALDTSSDVDMFDHDARPVSFRSTSDRFAEAQRAGRLRSDLPPESLLFVVLATVGWSTVLQSHRTLLLGEMTDERAASTVADLIRRLLT
jgi:AcrR family transcriptional regulator